MTIDLELFRFINGFAGHIPILDALMRLVVNEYFIPTTVSLMLLALWFDGPTPKERELNQRVVIYAVLALLLANAVVKASNLVYFRPRPFASHTVNLLFYRPTDSSFPSNPAAFGFSVAAAIWPKNRRLGGLLYALATLFAVARVYCGVHYPSDVLAGAGIGIVCGYLINRFGKLFEPLVRLSIALGRKFFLA